MHLLFSIVFNELSVWWLTPGLFLGFLYAWFFYSKSLVENPVLKKVLFTLRWLVVSLLMLLLLSPLLKSVKQQLQKPVVFIAQDASSSIAVSTKKGFDSIAYHKSLKELETKLSDDYEVKVLSFNDVIKNGFDFKEAGKQTDISNVFNYITQ